MMHVTDSSPRPALLWLLYFLLLLWVAMPHGMRTALVPYSCESAEAEAKPCLRQPLRPLSTNADIIRVYYTADAAFIAKRAKEIVETHDWGHVSLWPLWPPGMVVLQTLLYRISPDAPVALILVILTCAAWSFVFAQIAAMLRVAGNNLYVALLLPLLLVMTGEFTYFLHSGLFYTESLSVAFFLAGLGCLLSALPCTHYKKAAFAGVLLAVSAYMRAQTDMVMTAVFALFLLCVAGVALHRYRSLAPAALKKVFFAAPWFVLTATALLSYHAVTLPYRAAHQMEWIGASQSPIWRSIWQRPEEMPPVLQFMVDGGVLAGCAVDPGTCQEIHMRRAAQGEGIYTPADYQRFTLQTVAHHPLQWLRFKLSYLRDFWLRDMPESALLTLLLPLMLLYYPVSGSAMHGLLALFLGATAIGIIAPLLLVHIEPRYLYPLRLLILYSALMAPALPPRARNAYP